MILTIHQPLYMPWLGFFHKLASADVMVILDSVAYSRGDFVNRNRIISNTGSQLLTVPIKAFKLGTPINQITISGNDWKQLHLSRIQNSYRHTPFFGELFSGIEQIIDCHVTQEIVNLDLDLIQFFMRKLGITTKIVLQSEIQINSHGSRLIEDICTRLGSETYISGTQGIKYLDLKSFQDRGIEVLFQKYAHPIYAQGSKEFISNLSILDLIFRYGSESLDILLTSESRMQSIDEKRGINVK